MTPNETTPSTSTPTASTATPSPSTAAPETAAPAAATTPAENTTAPAQVTPAPEASKNPEAQAAAPAVDQGKPAPATTEKKSEGTEKVVPEKYTLNIPEGSPLTATHIEEFMKSAKENGLTNEEAQKQISRDHDVASRTVTAQVAAFEAQKEGWKSQISKDPEIGGMYGAELKENVMRANRALEKFASPDFVKELNRTGLGNHPEMVRIFMRIDKASSNDSAVFATGQGAEPPKETKNILYGG